MTKQVALLLIVALAVGTAWGNAVLATDRVAPGHTPEFRAYLNQQAEILGKSVQEQPAPQAMVNILGPEPFNSCPPSGWTQQTFHGSPWQLNTVTGRSNGTPGADGTCANCDADWYGTAHSILITPNMNFTNYVNINVTFDWYLSYIYVYETTSVEIRVGGGSWTVLWKRGSAGSGTQTLSLDAYSGQNNVQLGFRYNDYYNWGYWMQYDDVVVTGDQPVPNDVGVTKIISPDPLAPYWSYLDTFYPKAEVRNWGTAPQNNVPVRCVLRKSDGTQVYNEVVYLDLAVGQIDTAEFPFYAPPPAEETYLDTMRTELPGDQNAANDVKTATHKVTNYGQVCLTWNDGTFENGLSWTSPGGEWAVRFFSPFKPLPLSQVTMWLASWGTNAYPAEVRLYYNNAAGTAPDNNPFNTKSVTLQTEAWPSMVKNEIPYSPPLEITRDTFYVSYYQTSVSPSYPYIGMDGTPEVQTNNDWARHPSYLPNWAPAPYGYDAAYDFGINACYNAALLDGKMVNILVPGATVDSNTVVTPSVTIQNVGLMDRPNIQVMFQIINAGGTPVYEDMANSGPINKGQQKVVNFTTSWTAMPGNYTCKAWVSMMYDGDPTNDTITQPLFVRYLDVATEIVRPNPVEAPGLVPVQVRLRNLGNVPALVPRVDVTIEPDGYADYRENISIGVGSQVVVALTPWIAGAGFHNVTAWITYTDDMFHPNDTATRDVVIGNPDVGVTQITAPKGVIDTITPVTPKAKVKNNGDVAMDFRAWFFINDPTDAEVYREYFDVVGLAVGEEREVEFPEWSGLRVIGDYVATCSLALSDQNNGNNMLTQTFKVKAKAGAEWPYGWREMANALGEVKDGAFLTIDPETGIIYGARGNKSGDFYKYTVPEDTVSKGSWAALQTWPTGTEGKSASKGANGCYGGGYVWAVKGNNTPGFWAYSIEDNQWTQKKDVPLGTSNKKVKGGGDVVYVVRNDTGYVFLLKGGKTDFMRYNTALDSWEEMAPAPGTKWNKGSWLVYDGGNLIYAHMAKFHEFYTYDLTTGSWSSSSLEKMPMSSTKTGKNKKSKDGGDGAYDDGYIYALKGGNTCEFYRYSVAENKWTELDTMPQVGSTNKKKRVKGGGALVGYGNYAFFAFKGGKTTEFWRYVDQMTVFASAPERSGVMAQKSELGRLGFNVTPNPVVKGYGLLSYSVPQAGPAMVKVFDVTGRTVAEFNFVASGTGTKSLDLRQLSAGVYLVKFESAGNSLSQKLIVR